MRELCLRQKQQVCFYLDKNIGIKLYHINQIINEFVIFLVVLNKENFPDIFTKNRTEKFSRKISRKQKLKKEKCFNNK